MDIKEVEIGLPIYDDIKKQLRYRPYFYNRITEWYTPVNRLPAFQFYRKTDTANPISTANSNAVFVLVNSVTGVETDMLAHFTSAQILTTYTEHEYYKYNSATSVSPYMSDGLYYLKISDGVLTWYSEEFYVCSTIGIDPVAPPSGDNLLSATSSYFLINATDKISIN